MCSVEAEEGICSPGPLRSVSGSSQGFWCLPSSVHGLQPGDDLGCCLEDSRGAASAAVSQMLWGDKQDLAHVWEMRSSRYSDAVPSVDPVEPSNCTQ